MAITTSPDNIPSPTSGDPYNYVVDMAALADGTQDALTLRAKYDSDGRLQAADGVADDDVATVGQLYVAVTPTQQVFTSSGTWSKPTGLRAVRVRVIGGGGGGSGSSTNNAGGAGGGGGGYAESLVVASSLSSTVTVTVGPGGTGNIGSGSDGGTSVFSSHATATGGEGGSDVGYGGDGGGGTAGNILASGNAGQSTGDTSVYSTAGIFPGGVGGGSVLGGGGRGTPARAANVDGTPGAVVCRTRSTASAADDTHAHGSQVCGLCPGT